MAVRKFVVEFTLHGSFSFKLRPPQCLLTPIFTLMTSFFSFFLFLYLGSVYFHSRNCAGFNWKFAFSSAVNEDKLNFKSRRTVRFG